DADLARLVRAGKITRSLAEQRASVPEELKRLLGGGVVEAPASLGGNGSAQSEPVSTAPPAYTQGG
ncbi:MAG: hypothetical protein ACLGG5_09565, partial [Thermoleophilia bacterium]